MLGVLLPAAILFWIWRSSSKKEMTAPQKAVLDRALLSQNPDAIQKVAVAFGREGHGDVEKRLKRRASLAVREPAEVAFTCELFRNALNDPSGRGTTEKTRLVAKALAGKEMTESARFLLDFARGFERARSVAPVYVPPIGPAGRPEGGPESESFQSDVVADPMSAMPNIFDSEKAAEEPRDPDLPPGAVPGDPPIDMAPIVDEDLPPIPSAEGEMY